MAFNQNPSSALESRRESLSQPEENRPHRPALRKADGLCARGERRQPDGVAVPMRLLQAARAQEKERVYRLIKVPGGEGLRIQELPS